MSSLAAKSMLTGTWKNSKVDVFAFTWICLIYGHRLPCCRLYYLALSKLCRPINKKLWNIRAVDHTNNITIFIKVYDCFVIFDFIVCSFVDQLFINIHKFPLGGPGGIRTPVQNSFALKGLQQFFTLG